jgi:hypothetical protein
MFLAETEEGVISWLLAHWLICLVCLSLVSTLAVGLLAFFAVEVPEDYDTHYFAGFAGRLHVPEPDNEGDRHGKETRERET